MRALDGNYGTPATWINEVVVATDASPASRHGMELAADLAGRTGARLTFAHVRHLPSAAMPAMAASSFVDTLDELEAEVRGVVTNLLAGRAVDWRIVVLEGSPGEEISKLIAQVGADLVVVGANRHSTLHNLVLGSTSAHLTAHSTAAVLIVRPNTASGHLPRGRRANPEREPAEAMPTGSVQRRPVVLSGVPQGDERS
jgi:nucleotide-binding universal stress UspA family protein